MTAHRAELATAALLLALEGCSSNDDAGGRNGAGGGGSVGIGASSGAMSSGAMSSGAMSSGAMSSGASGGGPAGCPAGSGAPKPPAPIDAAVGTWVDITPMGVSLDASNPDNFGMQTIVIDPLSPANLFVGTCYQGIWKTSDYGEHWTKVSTGNNGANLESGRNWTMAIDPVAPTTLYTVAGYGGGQGIWKSVNGGVDWEQKLPVTTVDALGATSDVYSISVDPLDHRHLLVGFHSPFASGDAGVLESMNGGDDWVAHQPQPGWGEGHYVFFLGNSQTWLLATQGAGFWRTENSGGSWTKVSDINMQHGGDQLYRTSNGTLYVGALQTLLRSTDDGKTWTSVGPSNSDGYNAVIGDGTHLYAQTANTGGNTTGPLPYSVSMESDGVTWTPFNGQTFDDGPMSMAVDCVNRIVYSSNWRAGVWRLVTGN